MPRKLGSGADLDMPGRASAPPHDHEVAQSRTARDTDLGAENVMLADHYVVPDLHEIIDLAPLADPRRTKPASINRRVRADLDVIPHLDGADLRYFPVAAVFKLVAKAIGSDDRAGVNANSIAEHRIALERDVRGKMAIAAKRARRSDVAPRRDHASRANHRVASNRYERVDISVSSDSGGWIHIRQAVDAGTRLAPHALGNELAELGDFDRGILDPQKELPSLGAGIDILAEHHERSIRLAQLLNVLGRRNERSVAPSGLAQGRHASDAPYVKLAFKGRIVDAV